MMRRIGKFLCKHYFLLDLIFGILRSTLSFCDILLGVLLGVLQLFATNPLQIDVVVHVTLTVSATIKC